MRTAQEIFDTVVNHLRQQGETALSEDEQICAYRGRNGTKCAAGILIPDEMYSPKMEGHGIDTLLNGGLIPSPLREEFSHNRKLVNQLQFIHDGRNIHNWEDGFARVAQAFNLQYTPPTA